MNYYNNIFNSPQRYSHYSPTRIISYDGAREMLTSICQPKSTALVYDRFLEGSEYIEELKKPMYATCLGLILKGYSDYEHKYKEFNEQYKKVEVPRSLKTTINEPLTEQAPTKPEKVDVTEREHKIKFWDRFKDNLIDLFKEEEDKIIK